MGIVAILDQDGKLLHLGGNGCIKLLVWSDFNDYILFYSCCDNEREDRYAGNILQIWELFKMWNEQICNPPNKLNSRKGFRKPDKLV